MCFFVDADIRKSVTQVLMDSLFNLTKLLFVLCSQYLREKYLREKNRGFITRLAQCYQMSNVYGVGTCKTSKNCRGGSTW